CAAYIKIIAYGWLRAKSYHGFISRLNAFIILEYEIFYTVCTYFNVDVLYHKSTQCFQRKSIWFEQATHHRPFCLVATAVQSFVVFNDSCFGGWDGCGKNDLRWMRTCFGKIIGLKKSWCYPSFFAG